MTLPPEIRFEAPDADGLATTAGRVAVIVGPDGRLDRLAGRVDRLTRGALARLAASARFAEMEEGAAVELAWPAGMAAEAVVVVKLARRVDPLAARRAGAAIAAAAPEGELLLLAGPHPRAAELAFGLALRRYRYGEHRTGKDAAKPAGAVRVMTTRPEAVAASARDMAGLAEGVYFARDLVNAPANLLGTEDFAARLAAMGELGLEVEILEADELDRLGLRMMLAVAQGSRRPAKLVVMRWRGGGDGPPLALVGKGVVFDTGGISIKPAQGMEEMTADMGGAATVAGVMRALALRQAKADVVGLVGLVENMPDGAAMRPGDVIASMKGDTVEVINTDAEGRLVLGDVMWYAQDRFAPAALIDLATLTGAAVVALGHEKAGVFASDDGLAEALLAAAAAEGEGAWRLPLDPAYDRALKSDVADVRNVGGRAAGAVTAARFLARFVRAGTPWAHLDIAGVARTPEAGAFAPKGASGWGVLTLDRLIRERFGG